MGSAPARRRVARVRRGAPCECDRARDRASPRTRLRSTRRSIWSTSSTPRSPRPRASRAGIPPSASSRPCASPSTTSWASSTARCRSPGRCCASAACWPAIAFHSLEDRRVKHFMVERATRMHLSAGSAHLCLRPRARGGAALTARDRALTGGDRAQPTCRLRAPARGRQADAILEGRHDAARRSGTAGRAGAYSPPVPLPAGPPGGAGARPPPRPPPSLRRARPALAPHGPVALSAPAQRAQHARRRSAGSRLLDRLIRSRVWIALVAFALIGIVGMQLWMLKLNGGIGRAIEHESYLQRKMPHSAPKTPRGPQAIWSSATPSPTGCGSSRPER